LYDETGRYLLATAALLGMAMSVLRPAFPIHCNFKAKQGDELAVGLSFSMFYTALHCTGPLADKLLEHKERLVVIMTGVACTGGTFPLLLVHSHHLAETAGMVLVGESSTLPTS